MSRVSRSVVYVVPLARLHAGPIQTGWEECLPALPARECDLTPDQSIGTHRWGPAVHVRLATQAERAERESACPDESPWRIWGSRPIPTRAEAPPRDGVRVAP